MYRIIDCLSGEITNEEDYTKAHEIAESRGGRENGIIVEKVPEVIAPVSKSVEIVHNVPRRGELF